MYGLYFALLAVVLCWLKLLPHIRRMSPPPLCFIILNVAVEQREMFIFALCYNMKLELYELGTQRALIWKPLCLRGLVSERLLYAMLRNM